MKSALALSYCTPYSYNIILFFTVAGSIILTSSNYDAFEPDEAVSVCAVIMAEALERRIVVQLSSQDTTARSEFIYSSSMRNQTSTCRE